MTKLSEPTEIFDNCGAYDINTEGGPTIAKGSTFEAWKDALSFLEWYGIPHMDGFGIIIIDNVKKTKYAEITPDWNEADGESCFESAVKLAATAIASFATILLIA